MQSITTTSAWPGSKFFRTLPKDFLASIVAFLTALPLCMGIAIASGVPASAGLLAGIIGGLLVGFLSGSPLLVSGPAAGLTVLVWQIVHERGLLALGIITIIAGLLQLAAGLFKLGQWFRAVSPAVIYGMLSGIGILIVAAQLHVMLDDKPRGSGIDNLLAVPQAMTNCLNVTHGDCGHIAGLLGLATIALIVLWEAFAPKRLKIVPSALPAIILATVLAVVFHLDVHTVSVPNSLLEAIHLPWPGLFNFDRSLLMEGIAVAFIASAETLLSATAVDRLHLGPRTNYDRELMAQGIGNTICGIVGAVPMTGVIARSTVNIQAGASSRASAILHGAWLLLFVVLLPSVLRLVPTASLAALLVYTGYKLTNFTCIKTLIQYGKSEAAIYAATVVLIVTTDLLTGVITGIVLSMAKVLYIFSHLEIRKLTSISDVTDIAFYLKGTANFLSLPKLAAALESVPPNSRLHVHFEDLDYIDHACLDLIMSWETRHKATGGTLLIDWGALEAVFRDQNRVGELQAK